MYQLLSTDEQRSQIEFIDSILIADKNQFVSPVKKINKILEAKILLLPIHHNYHWSLAVVENFYNLIVEVEGLTPKKVTTAKKAAVAPPRILHYDSMMLEGRHAKSYVLGVVQKFLQTVSKKYGKHLLKLPQIETGSDCVGTQECSNDCGLFVCKFMEHVVLKNFVDGVGISTFSQEDCSKFRDDVRTLVVRLSCNNTKTREKSV